MGGYVSDGWVERKDFEQYMKIVTVNFEQLRDKDKRKHKFHMGYTKNIKKEKNDELLTFYTNCNLIQYKKCLI